MKNDFPRIYVSPEIRRKMLEIAGEFRKAPTKGEKILWEALRGKKLGRKDFATCAEDNSHRDSSYKAKYSLPIYGGG